MNKIQQKYETTNKTAVFKSFCPECGGKKNVVKFNNFDRMIQMAVQHEMGTGHKIEYL